VEGLGHLDGRSAWLLNGGGRYHEALAAAERGCAYPDDLGLGTWSVVELVEAAVSVRSGQKEKAARAFGRLCLAAGASDSDWCRGIVARCQALVSDADSAETLYLEAIDRLGRTGVEIELARARLLYGEWLRRAGRRVDARPQLRAAFKCFAAVGAKGFAERAQRELLATGETARKRTGGTPGALTPQEMEISQLAGAGYTNSEIGMKLFISRRTVDWHLQKVFVKLGVCSRRQLRPDVPSAGVREALSPL
jgi:DNA-binding CsgD family transcriptional regulator